MKDVLVVNGFNGVFETRTFPVEDFWIVCFDELAGNSGNRSISQSARRKEEREIFNARSLFHRATPA